MYKVIISTLILLLLVTVNAEADDDIWEYWKSTSDVVTIAWTPSPEPDWAYYNARCRWVETDSFYYIHRDSSDIIPYTMIYNKFMEADSQKWDLEKKLTNATIQIKAPRAGHFEYFVRSCDEANNCSEWSSSLNPNVATVDGHAKAWRIYYYLAAPEGLITGEVENEIAEKSVDYLTQKYGW